MEQPLNDPSTLLCLSFLKPLKIYFSNIMYKIHIANKDTAGIINNSSVPLLFFFINYPFPFKATSKRFNRLLNL